MHYSELTTSPWKPDFAPLVTEPLRRHLEADVCVVGAGMAGMSVAYELLRVGRSVVVLDDNAVGGGETAQSTAHLSSALDDRYYKLEEQHGASGARLAYQSHAAAIERIGYIASSENLDCDFERCDGYLFLAPGQQAEVLDRELTSAQRAGMADAQALTRAPNAPFDTGPCILFPHQAQMHPLRYVTGLGRLVQRLGGRIFTSTHVAKVHDARPRKRAWIETSDGYRVRAKVVVVATNSPINDRFVIHTKQAACRTYAVSYVVPSAARPYALFWDTGDPYHYVRWTRPEAGADDTLLIVGGEDHPTGHADDGNERFERLHEWTRERFVGIGEPRHRWSGQVLEPNDGLAFIGRNPGSHAICVVTGDSGHGLTHGAIAGMLIRDLVIEAQNPWEALYDPSRKHFTLPELARTGAQAASAYAQWLGPATAASALEIPRGEGRVLRQGLRRLAVYRDDDGSLRVCTAACPHLGGLLSWNRVERSWDCPLHGSRFDVDGHVLNGPAPCDLEQLPLSAAARGRKLAS